MGTVSPDDLLVPLVFVFLGLLYLGSIIWTAFDAASRDRSGCLIAILVLLTWPWGLLIWLLARPEKPERIRPASPEARAGAESGARIRAGHKNADSSGEAVP